MFPPSEYFPDGYNLNDRMYRDIDSYVLFLRDAYGGKIKVSGIPECNGGPGG